jgi:S-adenosylmethionine hydrolase
VSLITFTTDFGTRDWFVGTMKGVALGINARATIVDITHEIPSGDIRAGAFALAGSFQFFPTGTVHMAVVDPGVGSERKAIVVRTKSEFFVGPDNGVLSWALARTPAIAIHSVENPRYFLNPISRTFHGRDIFSPVAAHLSRGVAIHKFGPRVKHIEHLPWPKAEIKAHRVMGEVVYVDRFGNAITNIEAESVAAANQIKGKVFLRGKLLCSIASFYGSVRKGLPVAVFGSSGFLEIAVNGGNAARQFRIKAGASVAVKYR